MKKLLMASGLALSLAACGAGTVAVVQNIYDQIQAASQTLCGVYNPSHCQSVTAWVEPAWCGRRTRAWKPNEGNLVISVSCRR
jgi:hypothetical protein